MQVQILLFSQAHKKISHINVKEKRAYGGKLVIRRKKKTKEEKKKEEKIAREISKCKT